jgi:hypothetical protein
MTDPIRFYRVSTVRVVRERHERLIAARSPEDALAAYSQGTAWPSSYDTEHLETIEEQPVQVEIRDDDYTAYLGDPNDPANLGARGYWTHALQEELPYPDDKPPTTEVDL